MAGRGAHFVQGRLDPGPFPAGARARPHRGRARARAAGPGAGGGAVMSRLPPRPIGPATTSAEAIADLYDRSLAVLSSIRGRTDLESEPRRSPRFSITRTADLVGRTPAAIREAEKDGRLPEVSRTVTGRRVGYTLAEINHMREVFGTRPWRGADDPPAIIAVQNFKGGVGKSTVSTHL